MSEQPTSNPFSTRFVQPGALPYLFAADGPHAESLLDALSAKGCGAIVGPHGSGKSTLAASLAEVTSLSVQWIRLRIGERSNAATWNWRDWDAGVLVIVDGYEQLSAWKAWRLRATVRRAGAQLLVTSHAPPWRIPVLFRTQVTLEIVRRVVHRLLQGQPGEVITDDDIAAAFEKHGDGRETLFSLYDIYEQRCR